MRGKAKNAKYAENVKHAKNAKHVKNTEHAKNAKESTTLSRVHPCDAGMSLLTTLVIYTHTTRSTQHFEILFNFGLPVLIKVSKTPGKQEKQN